MVFKVGVMVHLVIFAVTCRAKGAGLAEDGISGGRCEVHRDVSNVLGLVGTSPDIFFLGSFDTVGVCEEACESFYRENGQNGLPCTSFSWQSGDAGLSGKAPCFGRVDGMWEPAVERGTMSGKMLRQSQGEYRPSRQGEREHTVSDAGREAQSERAMGKKPTEDIPAAQERHVHDFREGHKLAYSEQTGRQATRQDTMQSCTVLEWRLLGHLYVGAERRSILSGRSCSICGWEGCDRCPATQVCKAPGRHPLRVHYTSDHHQVSAADVVLFQAAGDFLRFQFPDKRDPRQAHVVIAGESSLWWPHIESLMDDSRFDLVMGYSRALSNVHASYLPHNYSELQGGRQDARAGLDVSGIVPSADIVHFASNCESEFRQSWVEELMLHLAVDSFGKCNKNRELPEELARVEQEGDADDALIRGQAHTTRQGGQSVVKRAITSLYKFGLAFENTRDQDYVTEKLFEVLQAGSVPIYMGAPNWRDFFPFPDAVIDASEFDSPEDLAAFVSSIAANDTHYQQYHSWKQQPFPASVADLEATSFKWNLCRVCRWWHEEYLSLQDGSTS